MAAKTKAFRLLCLCLLLALGGIGHALALDLAPLANAETAAPQLRAQLESLQTAIAQPSITATLIAEKRTQAEALRTSANVLLIALQGPLTEIDEQLQKIGPPPADGTGEAPAITKDRTSLDGLKARHAAARTSLDLVATGADQTISLAALKLRALFFSRVFDPGRSLFSPSLWTEGYGAVNILASRLSGLLGGWSADAARKSGSGAFAVFLALIAAVVAAIIFAQGWVSRLLERRRASRAQTAMDRIWRAIRRPVAWLLLIFAGLIILRILGASLGVLNDRAGRLIDAAFAVFGSVAVTASFVNSIVSPRLPQWRLAALDDGQAARLAKLGIAIAAVLAARDFIDEIGGFILLPLALAELRGALSALALIIAIFLALRALDPPLVREQYARMTERRFFRWLRHARMPAFIVIAVAALALLLGYVALADFITSQFIETLLVLVILYLLHKLIDAFIATQLGPDRASGRFLRNTIYATERGINRVKVLLRTLADVALFLIGLPVLFIQWTVTWIDLPSIASSLFNGISVGGLTISPSAIVSAIGVLLLGLFASNLFTRWLESRVLSETQLDKGVKDSVRKGTSYAGITLAGGFALAAAGINFSNVAIVAGALGVGIGFGLQSIVNNFVSGLILLAERPVKVGDWIVTSAGEGLVQRMKVRSTEIETFDKCTIIVPNSMLITESVRNWTHENYYGRFLVSVTVDYGNDPQAICDLLSAIALKHPKVLHEPGPGTIFAGFGQMGMNFELRATVANVFDAAIVASDVRIAVDCAFKERGIRIPVVQPPPAPVSKKK